MLIDNYVIAYGCALTELSNGRQAFQLPAYLAALVGVAGGAFGGGRDLAVASGIGASTANSANTYWDPQSKAGIIDHSLDAILCIKNEAVGNAFFDTTVDPTKMFELHAGGDTVELPVEWRYYGLISTALSQVDRITGDRLRGVGKYDPAGLVAEIEALQDKIDKAEADPAPETATDAPAGATGRDDANEDDEAEAAAAAAADTIEDGAAEADDNAAKALELLLAQRSQGSVTVDLNLLQPKLQRCVLRAKM